MEKLKQFYTEKLLQLKESKTFQNTKNFINRCKTVNKNLRTIFLIAVVWVLLYDFILVKIPEWFTGASTFGLLARNVSFAFITGFIFFFVNTHLPAHKTKVKTYRYTANKIASLTAFSSGLMRTINLVLGLSIDKDHISEEEFNKLCKQINAYSRVSYRVFGHRVVFDNWYKLFNFLDIETSRVVRDLLLVRDSLDSETLRLVTNIENKVNMFINVGKGNPIGTDNSIAFFADDIFEYRRMCKALTLHLSTEYKPFADEYNHMERTERKERKTLQQTQQQDIQS